ncbi:tetratricopeptide repeat protein [bacterium]|nr:tetratricopeptide repeat protein [bacterium]
MKISKIILVLIGISFLYSCAEAKESIHDKKIAEYKEAIKINPNDAVAHYNLGVIYGKDGLWGEATKEFEKTIRLKPDFAEAHNNLGLAYLNISRRGNALEEYEILKKLDEEAANKLFDYISK